MNLDEFRKSLGQPNPPAGLTHALAGLWWDAKGDWTRAHESAQQDEGTAGSLVGQPGDLFLGKLSAIVFELGEFDENTSTVLSASPLQET